MRFPFMGGNLIGLSAREFRKLSGRRLHVAQNRKNRGLGRPETFTFLGFTHICGKDRAQRGRSPNASKRPGQVQHSLRRVIPHPRSGSVLGEQPRPVHLRESHGTAADGKRRRLRQCQRIQRARRDRSREVSVECYVARGIKCMCSENASSRGARVLVIPDGKIKSCYVRYMYFAFASAAMTASMENFPAPAVISTRPTAIA
jgi:hypothetical protein